MGYIKPRLTRPTGTSSAKKSPMMRYNPVIGTTTLLKCCSPVATGGVPNPNSLIGFTFYTSDTNRFLVPSPATKLIVICIGVGGSSSQGGGGGGLAWSYDIPCIGGQLFIASVGGLLGPDSVFGSSSSGPYLVGGAGAASAGGSFSGNNVNLLGGNGGSGGGRRGGGAGGYYGNGGEPGVDGAGGGGSGSYTASSPAGGVGFNYFTPSNGTQRRDGSVGIAGASYGGGSSSIQNDGGPGAIFIGWY
jgi:hypothetical protein